MPLYSRDQVPSLLKAVKGGEIVPVYLLFGERYLCQQTARSLERILVAGGGTVHPVDGDSEDPATTLANLRSFSLLPGRQVFRVSDTRLFHSRNVAETLWKKAVTAFEAQKKEQAARALRAMFEAAGLDADAPDGDPAGLSETAWRELFGFARPGGDLAWIGEALAAGRPAPAKASNQGDDPAKRLLDTLAAGIPESNTLLLLAETVDKRKRLFKVLKNEYVVVDLSVDSGAGAKAQKAQKSVLLEIIGQTLAEMGKSMAPTTMDLLVERVGFHPVAARMETEKLALFVGERQRIEKEDLDAIVGRTRQEALFELTGAIGARDLERAMLIASRLQENNIHALAIIATLRNYTRSLLLFRALQEQLGSTYSPSMTAAAFQQHCLPRLKERQQWKKELQGHPYALYMQFKTATAFPLAVLRRWMRLLLAAEMRLKGSPLKADTVLHHLLLSMLAGSKTSR